MTRCFRCPFLISCFRRRPFDPETEKAKCTWMIMGRMPGTRTLLSSAFCYFFYGVFINSCNPFQLFIICLMHYSVLGGKILGKNYFSASLRLHPRKVYRHPSSGVRMPGCHGNRVFILSCSFFVSPPFIGFVAEIIHVVHYIIRLYPVLCR